MELEIRKSGIREWILDLFLPNVCPVCRRVMRWDLYCCEDCVKELEPIGEKQEKLLCPRCGKYVCVCAERGIRYDRCIAAGIYEGAVRKAVLSFKYDSNSNAAEIFACICAKRIEKAGIPADIITYVPMSARKRRMRGYNQAELFAAALSEKTGIPVRHGLLSRVYSVEEQHERTASERIESAGREYSAAEGAELSGERVILCDDVLTTGATMSSCAGILKDIGASEVTAVVCAGTL
ncbi:MAG: ComF family protein [Oscillospiraceae bacterium]|nr:ComF family protein [Oscillospiraceae bacterium]